MRPRGRAPSAVLGPQASSTTGQSCVADAASQAVRVTARCPSTAPHKHRSPTTRVSTRAPRTRRRYHACSVRSASVACGQEPAVPANDDSTEPASLTRARAFIGRGHFLQGAGGRDPGAPGPEGACGSRVGCDGPGFVAWCLGYDRYQPAFAGGWDWVEPDAMILEAESTGRWFQPLAIPELGALIVYPSIELVRAGRIDRRGHVGLVA